MAAKVKAENIIQENPVGRSHFALRYNIRQRLGLTLLPLVVFSKTYCPYCTQTKKLLSTQGVTPYILELDTIGE
jgi:hypothetical protein